jgi:hypothetical protein
MKKITVLMLLIAFQFASAQINNSASANSKVTTYKNGYNGMEYIVTSKKETIIVSTFNSKLDIKSEIAEKIYNYYNQNKDNSYQDGDTITIHGNDAKVTGKFVVTKKGKLTAVEFYYEKVEWNSGLTELYKKNIS